MTARGTVLTCPVASGALQLPLTKRVCSTAWLALTDASSSVPAAALKAREGASVVAVAAGVHALQPSASAILAGAEGARVAATPAIIAPSAADSSNALHHRMRSWPRVGI